MRNVQEVRENRNLLLNDSPEEARRFKILFDVLISLSFFLSFSFFFFFVSFSFFFFLEIATTFTDKLKFRIQLVSNYLTFLKLPIFIS